MQVTVVYETQLKRAVGLPSEDVTLADGGTIAGVIRAVVERHGDAIGRMLLDADGNVRPSVLVFLQDEQVSRDDDVALSEGATITLMSPVSGG